MTFPSRISRRTLLAALAATAAGLTACGSGSQNPSSVPAAATGSAPDAGAFPVTIAHAFGETVIERAPTRVATLGWSDDDMAMALGVVPVGATAKTWGGNAAKSTDWFDAELARLGGAQPVRYDDTDGAPVEEVAKVAPELILATNSGITREEYDQLSKIAPVVAYPGAPWVTPWETSLDLVGRALGRSGAARDALNRTTAVIDAAKARFPALAGASVIFAYLTAADLSTIGIYGPDDNRVRTLRQFGMTDPPIVTQTVKPGEFYASVSAEQASTLQSDVLLTYAESEQDLATFRAHPLIGQVPAIREGRAYAEVDKHIGLSITNPSPLSMPFIVEHFLPEVAAVAPKR